MYPSYLEYFRERDSSSLVDFDYDRNLFEFEQNSALPVLKGRLRSCLSYWHTIGASSFVIGTIKFGYQIPFIQLPFGLSSAPYVFTKCLRPLVKFWRSNGIKIVVFLDDGCGKGDSLPMAKENSLFVQSSLSSAGFVANSAKSLWNPTQVLVWLGLNWDLVTGTISITDRRISEFIAPD